MIAVVQRAAEAAVAIDGKEIAHCGRGFLILLGVAAGDTEEDAAYLADKIGRLRIFTDERGKMSLALDDVGGEVLAVSNFTLLANCTHGNRPDFLSAMKPPEAERLYMDFVQRLSAYAPVHTGVFGADMQVSLTGDGPVTILLDSRMRKGAGEQGAPT